MQAREKFVLIFQKVVNCKYSDHCRYKHVTQQNTDESHHFFRGNKDCSQKYERNFGIPETISSAGAKLQQPVCAHSCSNTSSMASGHPVLGKRPNLRA